MTSEGSGGGPKVLRKVLGRWLSTPEGNGQPLLAVISLSPRTFLCLRDPATYQLYRSSRAIVDPKLKTLALPCLFLLYLILWTITFFGVTRLNKTDGDKILIDWLYFGGCLAAMVSLTTALLIICLGRRWRCAQVRLKTRTRLEAIEEQLQQKPDNPVEIPIPLTEVEPNNSQKPKRFSSSFVDICCTQTVLVVAFLSFVSSIVVLRVWTMHREDDIPELRLIDIFMALNAFGCHIFILGIFLVSRSLYLSARTCAYLFLAHLALIIVTPVYGFVALGNIFSEELTIVFLTMVASAVAFMSEVKAELLRQFIFHSALRAVSVSEDDPCDATTTTGMEQVLAHLTQISRLAIMASASCPGSLRHTENAVQILVFVAECQRMLTRYNELFKVRVIGGSREECNLPIVEYAKMYGIDVGQQQPPASQHLRRDGRLAVSTDTIKRFSLATPMPSMDFRELQDALLSITDRENQQRLMSARPPSRNEGGASRSQPVRHLVPSEATSRAGTSGLPVADDCESASVGGGSMSGYVHPEVPSRLLASKLDKCVGKDWTIDLFALNAECNDNILFEVGYCLLAEDISKTVRRNSSFIDPILKDTTPSQAFCESARDSQHVADLQLHMYLNFLSCLQKQYRSLPYHNGVHGAHVAHSMACLQRYLNLSNGASWDMSIRFASLLAAMGHDVGHPGRNNSYLMKTYDPLTVIYNDISVLENYHSCLLFMTLELENCNVLFPFTAEVFRLMRELIIRLILATDMKSHFEQLARFRLRRSNNDFSPSNELNDLKLVLELCIKVSDLAASACRWDVHLGWCFRVAEEFYRQGEEEMNAGLPMSPLCDRSKHNEEFAKSQMGFIDFVTSPLFLELSAFAPDEQIILDLHNTILRNRNKWIEAMEGQDVAMPSCILLSPHTRDDDRRRFRRRRWTSVVGDFGQDSPFKPLVESERRDRRQPDDASSIGDDELNSLGEIMSCSSWDDESWSGIAQEGPPSSRRKSDHTDKRSAGDMERRHRRQQRRVTSEHTLRRDNALSPSARVMGLESDWEAVKVIDVVKRRASVLRIE